MQYIIVCEYEDSDCIEIPQEEDETVLLTTLSGIFPKVCGLKFRSPDSGAFRALRLSDGKFYQPIEGWSNFRFCCVFPKDNKRKNAEESEKPIQKSKRIEGRKCTDLIVLNLGWNVDEEELKKYFIKFGELVLVQVKRDRESNQSKGFAFIRFEEYESQVMCLAEKHLIDSRWCPVKVPFSKNEADKQEISKKIHISYQSEEITADDIRDLFDMYGYVVDIFIPKPFRHFAFVTFDSADVVQALIGHTFDVKGHSVTVGSAVPKVNKKNNDMQYQDQYQDVQSMQNQAMQARYGMLNTYGPQKVRGGGMGGGQNIQFQGFSGLLPSAAMQYMMAGNQSKSGQEAIQQAYANQDMLQQVLYGATGAGQHQVMAASTAMSILNNPDVVAAIVAAANNGASAQSSMGNRHAKYGPNQQN